MYGLEKSIKWENNKINILKKEYLKLLLFYKK
jgi:hypothetical protein